MGTPRQDARCTLSVQLEKAFHLLRHRLPLGWATVSVVLSYGAGSFTDEKLIEFLVQLRRQFRGKKVILVWDGLPSHRSRIMTKHLEKQTRWLTVVRLPSYAPELNPVESLWGNIQGKELANRSVDDLGGMVDGVRQGFSRIDSQGELLQSFLKTCWSLFRPKDHFIMRGSIVLKCLQVLNKCNCDKPPENRIAALFPFSGCFRLGQLL